MIVPGARPMHPQPPGAALGNGIAIMTADLTNHATACANGQGPRKHSIATIVTRTIVLPEASPLSPNIRASRFGADMKSARWCHPCQSHAQSAAVIQA